ncbi:hypothetical protein BABINDRAFT_26888, partial [Babjeviella inositovora NRRL Y-12698]
DIESVDAEIARQYQLNEKVTNEEYKIWKKTVPLLYDTVQSHALQFLSLTCQWLPEVELDADKQSLRAQFVFGTNTSGYQQDYLQVGSIQLPETLDSQNAIPVPTTNDPTFNVVKKWKHNGEVNKAKVSPNGKLIATLSNSGSVYVFDRFSSGEGHRTELKYHTKEGYALNWINDSELLSGTDDGKISSWDVNRDVPVNAFASHSATVNDISANKVHQFLFASASDDQTYQVHDLRTPATPFITRNLGAAVNAVCFHPELGTMFATGSADMVVGLWDLRKPSAPFRQLRGHTGAVTNVEFSPTDSSYVMSNAADKRINIWNLEHLGSDFDEENYFSRNEKGAYYDPCLEFIHAGHTYKVNDMAYHPSLSHVSISVGDDNLLEVWK